AGLRAGDPRRRSPAPLLALLSGRARRPASAEGARPGPLHRAGTDAGTRRQPGCVIGGGGRQYLHPPPPAGGGSGRRL
ncbi:MAG: hypothetical protein AVDCRST_MAG18-1368, partial [uncultured Thermomicrobiales bacterium]